MIKHLSYTSLNRLAMCAKSWEFAYIDKVITPVNGELVRGDAYHKAIAHVYTSMVIYREKPGIDEALQIYSDVWDKRLQDKIIIDEGEEIYTPAVDFRDKDPGKMKDDGLKLVKIYYDTIIPKIIPKEVEVKKTNIYEGVPLLAYIDLIEWTDVVDDHKIKAKMFSESELVKDLQPSFYGLVLGVDKLEFNFHAAIAVKEPHVEIVPANRSRNEIDWIGRMVTSAWRQIESGIFTPSSQGWWCSQDYCPYWGICRMPRWF